MTLPRLYPILDTDTLARRGCAVEAAARGMLAGGARIMQFRHKGFFSRQVFEQAERVAELCRGAGAEFIVDDRSDIAMLIDGAGVHLGQEDLSPADVRPILGPERAIGFSTHNEEQLRAAGAEPVDYVALGPIFETASKQRPDPVLGVEALRRLRPLSARPLVAIGGITLDNAAAVLEAGADSVAVIAGLLPEPCNETTIRQRMEEWLKRVS